MHYEPAVDVVVRPECLGIGFLQDLDPDIQIFIFTKGKLEISVSWKRKILQMGWVVALGFLDREEVIYHDNAPDSTDVKPNCVDPVLVYFGDWE